MGNDHSQLSTVNSPLFDRVVTILEQARVNVVRSVNSNMVLAYWLIGREIVEEIQHGDQRAEYGKQVIKKLSRQLTEKIGKGFSVTNLKLFRQFYQILQDRLEIGYPAGSLLPTESATRRVANSNTTPSLLEKGFLMVITFTSIWCFIILCSNASCLLI